MIKDNNLDGEDNMYNTIEGNNQMTRSENFNKNGQKLSSFRNQIEKK